MASNIPKAVIMTLTKLKKGLVCALKRESNKKNAIKEPLIAIPNRKGRVILYIRMIFFTCNAKFRKKSVIKEIFRE